MSVTQETKREQIAQVWEWSGTNIPETHALGDAPRVLRESNGRVFRS